MIAPAGKGAVLGLLAGDGVVPSLAVGKVSAPLVPQAVIRVLPRINAEQTTAARVNKWRMF